MIFCTYTHFIHESSNKFFINIIPFKKSLILPTITNKPIKPKFHQNTFIFISATITENPDRKWGSANHSEEERDTVVNITVSGKTCQ